MKSGLTDFQQWWRHAFGEKTPWGGSDSPALVTAVESALERELSTAIMRGGAKPKIRRLRQGDRLTEQGHLSDEIFLLLNGVLAVEVDGSVLAEVGPGAVLGERAALEGGLRTATLQASTQCTVAVATRHQLRHDQLLELGAGHHREDLGRDPHPE